MRVGGLCHGAFSLGMRGRAMLAPDAVEVLGLPPDASEDLFATSDDPILSDMRGLC